MNSLVRIFVPLACGYYVSYVYRNINAAVFRDLVADLGLRASDLGLLTSAYLFVFAAAQLPVGMLLDRYGPRRVNAALFVVAAAGSLGFALGRTAAELVIGRAFIGLGVAAGLMAAMKAFVDFFPLSRLAGLNGLLMAVGGLGAMTATAPAEAAVRAAGWRVVFIGLGGMSLVVAALVFFLVPERDPRQARRAAASDMLRGLWAVLTDPFFWRVTFASCMTLGPALALQGLWVGPWLHDVQGLDRAASARVLFLLTVALTAGFLLSGKISSWARRLGLRMIQTLACVGLLSGLALAGVALGPDWLGIPLWFVYIFVTAGATLAYPVLAERFSGELIGRVNASLNMATFVTAFAAQYGIGPVLDSWAISPGVYPPGAYRAAFGVIVALLAVSLLCMWPALGPRLARGVER